MYKIAPIDGALKGWVWDAKEKSLRHYDPQKRISLGVIQLVSVQQDDREVYQQPWWLEARGEVDVVVDTNQCFVLVEAERHALIAPQQYEHDWPATFPDPFKFSPGVAELELPRGFAAHFGQEAEEETGYEIEHVATLGHLSANTSFFGTSPFVAVCRAVPRSARRASEPTEPIRRTVLKTPEEVARLTTCCGISKAALWEFCQWAFLKQKDSWWRDVAQRLVFGWLEPVRNEPQTVDAESRSG
jgi:hypothetical protein